MLRDLAKALPNDKMEPIMMEGAKVIAADARRRAPMGPTGNLKKSIITKFLKQIKNYPRTAMAAVNQRKAPHAHLVEFGSPGRYKKKNKAGAKRHYPMGTYFGPMPAHPFWRPAIDTNWKRVETDIINKLWNIILTVVRK